MDLKEWKGEEVTIRVDYEGCAGHAACEEVCPSEVYEIQDGKAFPVNIDDCVQCCACAEACPVLAIVHSACE